MGLQRPLSPPPEEYAPDYNIFILPFIFFVVLYLEVWLQFVDLIQDVIIKAWVYRNSAYNLFHESLYK